MSPTHTEGAGGINFKCQWRSSCGIMNEEVVREVICIKTQSKYVRHPRLQCKQKTIMQRNGDLVFIGIKKNKCGAILTTGSHASFQTLPAPRPAFPGRVCRILYLPTAALTPKWHVVCDKWQGASDKCISLTLASCHNTPVWKGCLPYRGWVIQRPATCHCGVKAA